MADEAARFKDYFSDFGGRAYLDCAAQGPFPKETAAEVRRWEAGVFEQGPPAASPGRAPSPVEG